MRPRHDALQRLDAPPPGSGCAPALCVLLLVLCGCPSRAAPGVDLAANPDLTVIRRDLAGVPVDLAATPDDLAGAPDLRAVDLAQPDPGDMARDPRPDYVPGVIVSTLAGDEAPGITDGTGPTARFANPTGLAFDVDGSLLVSDYDSWRLRRVTPAGVVTTLIASEPAFSGPYGVTVSTTGLIVVGTDFSKKGIKDNTSGTLWAILPSLPPQPLLEGLGRPRGLAALFGGLIFVTDRLNHTVGVYNPVDGSMTILAGVPGQAGFADGKGSEARFSSPGGCAALPDGSVLVADYSNHRVRRVTLAGDVTTYAGDGNADTVDADQKTAARFVYPGDLAVDAAGNVFVTDRGDLRVRIIRTSGRTQTLAGDGTRDFQDGPGETARFYGLEGLEVSADGNTVYVTDGNQGDASRHHRLRRLAVP